MSIYSSPDRKITEKTARHILGKEANCYSAEQLEDIINRLYEIAEFSIRFDRGDFD